MSDSNDSSLKVTHDELIDLVKQSLINVKNAPNRQFTSVISETFRLASLANKLRPGASSLTGQDHQEVEDILKEFGRIGLIIPGLGDPRSSAKEFPFFRVAPKLLNDKDDKSKSGSSVATAKPLGKGSTLHTTFQSYTLIEILGEGGVGVVWKAVDEDGQYWALKLLKAKSSTSKTKRFKNELTFCKTHRHRHIIDVHDHGVDGDQHQKFYVMRMLDGSLKGLIPIVTDATKRLRYIEQILHGAEAAHLLGVYHRDIKPENILYDKAQDCLVLADFGIAEFKEEEYYTLVETLPTERLANFQYAAPEQRNRGGIVDQRADIYAIGLIINEWFTGSIPQGSGYIKISDKNPELGWLDSVVESMIQQVPANRSGTIQEVKNAINRHQKDFTAKQRLDSLTEQVVTEGTITDLLAVKDPTIVDANYSKGQLSITLDPQINSDYIQAFKSSYSRQSVMGKGPEAFSWSGNKTARISTNSSNEAQQIIDSFKSWLPMVRAIYCQNIETVKRQTAEREFKAAELERLQLEDEIRFRKNVRF